jgi:signal transduction histidine kinase/PAS domain-containing protein
MLARAADRGVAADERWGAAVTHRLSDAGQASVAAGPDVGLAGFLGVAFERSAVAMLLIDPRETIRCANAAAAEMLDAGDLPGRSVRDFRIADGAADADPETAALATGELDHLERSVVIRSASGRRLQAVMRVDAVTLPDGTRAFLAQLRDVTTAQAHETARADIELRYRELINNLPGMSVLMFDHDLRLLVAGGEVLERAGLDTQTMPGRLIADIFPGPAMTLLEDPYRAALTGDDRDFEYSSPIDGRQYRIRVRPVSAGDGTIIGGLALSEDVTADRARRTMLAQVQRLSNVGTLSYDTIGGWVMDDELIRLLGVDSAEDAGLAMDTLVLPEDREPTRAAYRRVLRSGGRADLQYRLIHGKTGELRHVIGAVEAVVDNASTLLRAVVTHADVTDAVLAQADRAAAAQARTVLLRKVSDALAQPPGSLPDMTRSIVDVAAAALGGGTVLRILAPDGAAVDTDLVADSDEQARERMIQSLADTAPTFDPGPDVQDPGSGAGQLCSSFRNTDWRTQFQRRLGCPPSADVEHFISAPVRHDGAVLGFLSVYRRDRDKPYQAGDDDLIQVLADRLGSAIADNRVREQLERHRTEAMAIADRLHELTAEQRELLDQLGSVEERERTLLAEAIHDGPLQLVLGVKMGIDTIGRRRQPFAVDDAQRLADTLETAMHQLRTLIVALTPPDLSQGLGVALRNLAEGIFIGTPTEVTVLGPAHVHLTPQTKGNAYRILREAMVNARKHAHARHLVLDLQEHDNTVTARVTDDGDGAHNLNAGPGHLGMATMRARTHTEGGRLDITSTPGTGTTVTLILPTATTPGNDPTTPTTQTTGSPPPP